MRPSLSAYSRCHSLFVVCPGRMVGHSGRCRIRCLLRLRIVTDHRNYRTQSCFQTSLDEGVTLMPMRMLMSTSALTLKKKMISRITLTTVLTLMRILTTLLSSATEIARPCCPSRGTATTRLVATRSNRSGRSRNPWIASSYDSMKRHFSPF
jgi:hypothetical protein